MPKGSMAQFLMTGHTTLMNIIIRRTMAFYKTVAQHEKTIKDLNDKLNKTIVNYEKIIKELNDN